MVPQDPRLPGSVEASYLTAGSVHLGISTPG